MRIGEITAEKRARNVAIVGLLLHVALGLCLLVLYLFNHSAATFAASRLMFGGLFIWVVLVVLYQQRRRVAQESLETERLRQERTTVGSESIFEMEEEEFLVSQRRLRWLQRWFLPAFVMLAVAYLVIGHFFVWPVGLLGQITDHDIWPEIVAASLSMLTVAGVAFVSFLFSRYVGGMAQEPEYRLLKSGSIYLLANAGVCLLLTICLGLASTGLILPERVLAVAVRYFMVVLGLEFLVNFVLGYYRPRVSDEALRPAFESRLIGLVSEPGGIAKSIADAANYQFGFEVSATWFYKMVERAVVPLAALAVVVLVAMSSVVVVDADELAVIETFGRPSSKIPVKPGLHFKWPWPVETVRKAKVGVVQQEVIGEAEESADEAKKFGQDGTETVITWTDEHKFVPSVDVLVATRREGGAGVSDENGSEEEGGAVAVSILRMSMPVQYTVRSDPEGFFDYIYNYAEPRAVLRDIAYRELVKQAVHFDYQKIMGEQRGEVTERLEKLIQEKCDEMELGLKIVFVGLQDVHPPTESEVAATFQKVATAEQQRDTLIKSARVDYTKELVGVTGNVRRAEHIYELLQRRDLLPPDDAEQRQAITRELEQSMLGDLQAGVAPVQGEAGQIIQMALADAHDKINQAAAKVNTFRLELAAYEASPRLYEMRKVLGAISGQLDNVRKFVVVLDPENTNVMIQFVEQEAAGLEIVESPTRK